MNFDWGGGTKSVEPPLLLQSPLVHLFPAPEGADIAALPIACNYVCSL